MFNKTQYKLLIENYMAKYNVSYTTAQHELSYLHKIEKSTKEDIIENFNISML